MSSPTNPPSRRNAKIAVVVAVGGLIGLAAWLGAFDVLGDSAKLAAKLVELGGWGYLAFILTYALLQPFGVPGTVFIFAAPMIWPWPVAFALSMTGTMAASVIGFSFSRFIARDWLAPKIPARFRKYEDALVRRPFVTVFTLRLILWMPPLLHAFFGVSKVRGSTHFWGSLVGYVIPLFLVSFFGQRLFELLKSAPRNVWIGMAITVAMIVIVVFVWKRCKARDRRATPSVT